MSTRTFDYIVVGAGSAGCVAANRLVKAGKSVLLIEAGPGDKNPMIHMPGGTQEVIRNKKLNWRMDIEAQRQLNERKLLQHRGKMLGGCSNINGMVAIRGNAADFDHWESLGNSGWGYKDVLNNFKSIENWCGTDNEYHSSKGELYINKTLGDCPLFDQFIQAGTELGLPLNDDFNGRTQEGVGRYHANIHNGQRWGSARAFITPLKGNPNLTVETGVQVEKVLFNGKKASGVVGNQNGKKVQFNVSQEIILSGGAFNSPQLLLLSGIGRGERLQQLGIPVLHDLPGVGQNLQDHISLLMNYYCSLPVTMNGPANSLPQQIGIALNYFLFKKGIGTLNSIEAGAFWYSKPELTVPDIQLHFVPTLMYNLVDQVPKEHGVSIRACNLTPYSRGYVDLYSADPLQHPKIDFNFLGDDRDLPILLAAFRLVEKFMRAKAWSGVIDVNETKGASKCSSDEDIIAYIREYIETDYHPVGTCKMGVDPLAVVDPKLRVHGVAGLRVADASIMPTIVRGNTNVPAMMIGDKVAQMILQG